MDTAASGLDAFGKLAPYLQHPLVLIGFVLLLVFGVHRLLIKSGIIPPVDQTTGGHIVQTLLRYGFIIALVIIILGFAYVFLQRPSTDARTELGVLLGAFLLCGFLIFVGWRLERRRLPADTDRQAEQIVSILQEQLRSREHEARAKDDTIRELSEALRDAVGTIAAKVEAPGRHPAADQAFARLREGDTRAAEDIFRQIEEAKVAEGQTAYREAAEAARRRGALAYLRSTTEALAAYRRAAELDPDDFATWIFIARLEKRSGDLADAERAARQALAIAETMPDDRSQSLAHDELGDVKRAQGDLPAALAAYDASLAIRKRLAEADPGNAEWQRDISVSWERIGDVKRAQGDLPAALAAYDASLAIRKRLAEADPGNAEWQRDLSVSWDRIGDVKRAQGDLPAALAAYDASLAIGKRLAEADPGNAEWQRDLSVSWDRIGDVKRAQGDLPAALAAYDASLAIGKRLAEADPGNAEWQRDLIVSHVKLAEWFSEQPDGAGRAGQHYRQALDVVRTLQASARLNPADAWMADDLEQRLATAEAAGQ